MITINTFVAAAVTCPIKDSYNWLHVNRHTH